MPLAAHFLTRRIRGHDFAAKNAAFGKKHSAGGNLRPANIDADGVEVARILPEGERGGYLLQQRMDFVPTIETPHGLTQAEIRILYLWPDRGTLIPALSLVRLGRGKMMGVDHNRDKEWVGASAAFFRR